MSLGRGTLSELGTTMQNVFYERTQHTRHTPGSVHSKGVDSSQRSNANCGAMSRAANSRTAAWQPTIPRRPLTSAELQSKKPHRLVVPTQYVARRGLGLSSDCSSVGAVCLDRSAVIDFSLPMSAPRQSVCKSLG